MKKNGFIIRRTGNKLIDDSIGDAVTNYLNAQEEKSYIGRENWKTIYGVESAFKDLESAQNYAVRNGIENPLILDYVPSYITVEEACEILNVSRQRVSQLIASWKLIARNGKGILKSTVLIQQHVSKNGRPINTFKERD